MLADGRLLIRCDGELDLASGPTLDRALRQARSDRRSVLLDLSALTFMDSTGLNLLVQAARRARAEDWEFLIHPELAAEPRRVLEVCGLLGSLPWGPQPSGRPA